MARPIAPKKRVEVIDVVRGFAVFGILVVNMAVFKSAVQYTPGEWPSRLPDQAVTALVRLLLAGKFYLLFTFLFGLGFHLQMSRATERGTAFVALYGRRLLILLLFGLSHALLLWSGDILARYAIAGFVLLIFRNASIRALLVSAGLLILVSIVATGAGLALTIDRVGDLARSVPDAYANGSYTEVRLAALKELAFSYHPVNFAGTTLYVLAYFLVGTAIGKTRVFRDPGSCRAALRKGLGWGLALGLPANLIAVLATGSSAADTTLAGLAFGMLAMVVGGPALATSYVSGLVLLWLRESWRWILRPLAAVGRMALTNYLTQSLICTTLFYGYGLGLYGRLGPFAGVLVSLGVFAAQVLFSNLWLRRFRYGPLEWLWRRWTYGRLAVPTS